MCFKDNLCVSDCPLRSASWPPPSTPCARSFLKVYHDEDCDDNDDEDCDDDDDEDGDDDNDDKVVKEDMNVDKLARLTVIWI